GRQLELHHVLPAIEDDEERRLLAALPDAALLHAAVEQHAEAAGVAVVPLRRAHFLAGRAHTSDVLDAELPVVGARKEALLPQDAVLVAKAGQLLNEADQAID